MPDIPVGSQIFDVVFHPHEPIVYTGLLTGDIKAFGYDDQGQHQAKFTLRPSKRSCRSLAISEDGSQLWAVGKGKILYTIDAGTGKLTDSITAAHDSPINRIKRLMPHLLSTGDDEGVIKLWDPRKPEAIRAYTQHFDFISDFMWLDDKKQLVATSGDGTLSVMDVRAKKTEPFAQSEDQEDELLSILPIKSGTKVVIGTQLGILSVFNRAKGWGDCVDRIPGHPHSIDALCALPSSYPSSHSTILTGSSDGLLRAVELFPTKLVGVIADHGDFPIERIAVDLGGEGRWVGSVGHDEVLRMTDLKDVFEDEDPEEENDTGEREESVVDEDKDEEMESDMPGDIDGGEPTISVSKRRLEVGSDDEETTSTKDASDAEDSDVPQTRKKKRKKEKDALSGKAKKKGRNQVEADPSFFSGL
ncbi:WD40 repeat-like protein [Auriscalpium vulgare]|uniref:WD40 repeat-like protein n=1 Tax=Auriscalpium vulgare TaxID=40419 RepID=A0ACB8S999_9AGAM|nr:WD40 repeat-like protein [Auriscalpium vulgare]